jgi:hypothetical protein
MADLKPVPTFPLIFMVPRLLLENEVGYAPPEKRRGVIIHAPIENLKPRT